MEQIKNFFSWLRRWISPVYVAMLVAAFILWFITELGGTYTTDHDVTVVIDNVEYNVDCTIKGKGIDLLNYTLSSERSESKILPSRTILSTISTTRSPSSPISMTSSLMFNSLHLSALAMRDSTLSAPLSREMNISSVPVNIGMIPSGWMNWS